MMKYDPFRDSAAFAQLQSEVGDARPMLSLPDPNVRRAIRTASQVSQSTAAALCGVTQRCLIDWEMGVVEPRPNHRDRYGRLLRVLCKLALAEHAETWN